MDFQGIFAALLKSFTDGVSLSLQLHGKIQSTVALIISANDDKAQKINHQPYISRLMWEIGRKKCSSLLFLFKALDVEKRCLNLHQLMEVNILSANTKSKVSKDSANFFHTITEQARYPFVFYPNCVGNLCFLFFIWPIMWIQASCILWTSSFTSEFSSLSLAL